MKPDYKIEITPARQQQLLDVLYIIKECSQQLGEKSIKYWNNSLIDFHEIDNDTDNGYVCLLKVNYISVGTITIKPDNQSDKTLLIGKLAIHPAYQKKGFAQKLISWSIDKGKEANYKILKGYSPTDDTALLKLLEQNNFINEGEVPPPKKEYVRLVFEKTL